MEGMIARATVRYAHITLPPSPCRVTYTDKVSGVCGIQHFSSFFASIYQQKKGRTLIHIGLFLIHEDLSCIKD